jgi:dienelactone hydrolase
MRRLLPAAFLLFPIHGVCLCQDSASFPGTAPLDWTAGDFSVRIMDGAHAFVEAEIASVAARTTSQPLDPAGRAAFVEDSRLALREKLGVVDERLAPGLEFVSFNPVDYDGEPSSMKVADGPGFRVHAVRWPVLAGFTAEGLYVNPLSEEPGSPAPPLMVLMPDAGETPEDILGMTARLPSHRQIGLRFALAGFRLLIPAAVNRERYGGPEGKDEAILKTDQTHREWIYRQAFQMGRHPLGYEVQAMLAALDWYAMQFPGSEVTAAGYGEGGRVAMYAAALDDRFSHAFISGAFASRAKAWEEPIYRNLFGLLPDHGDAEVAGLIYPRPLLLEHTTFPEVKEQKGDLTTPPYAEVEAEFQRIAKVLNALSAPAGFFLNEAANGARGDYPSVAGFLQAIGREPDISRTPPLALLIDERVGFDPADREARVFAGMQNHVQSLVDGSEKARDEFYFYKAEPGLRRGSWSTEKTHERLGPLDFMTRSEEWRERFETEIIGRFDEELLPLRPRTRKVRETDAWTAWDVVLDVYPGFEAWGTLVMPKNLPAGEKRPVVVCQHGRNGVPLDTISEGKSAYGDYAARLAERGFITFAPHNLYRGEDRYRWLDRKANLIGGTLFTFITASHRQTLTWLQSLPEVDGKRIAFYGLSYGGETAVRVPAVIPDYCLSICSGDFNQWTRKVADPDFPGSFMKSIEWEMPYWNMGLRYDYAAMAGLIFPRPFFVERGQHDLVSTDEWVAHEYAKVRFLYSRFGMEDKTGIEFFHGGHSINGQSSFEFLHHHLDWPMRE